MRKIVSFGLLMCLFLVSLLPVRATEIDCTTIYFEDGSYLTITVERMQSRTTNYITGSRNCVYTGSDGAQKWKVVLTGTFSYTESSATCTSSSSTVTIYDSGWYQMAKTSGKSGATATAEVTMGYKVLGITTKQVPVSLTITCDANGNLS